MKDSEFTITIQMMAWFKSFESTTNNEVINELQNCMTTNISNFLVSSNANFHNYLHLNLRQCHQTLYTYV